jgi:hypothetical protein
MPKQGTLTKAHIINAMAEQNGFTQKKSYETMEIQISYFTMKIALFFGHYRA